MIRALVCARSLGFSYDLVKKNVYVDGFDRDDVVSYRKEQYLPRQEEVERRSYLWVPFAWLEVSPLEV